MKINFKNFNVQSLLVMFTLAIFFTACTQETTPVEAIQAPDLNVLALEIGESAEYTKVQEIRIAIFEEVSNVYLENRDKIDADPTILNELLSSATSYENELRAATEELKAKFSVLSTLSEEDVATAFEFADAINTSEKSCWDFCHDQYLSCDRTCYARYLYFDDDVFSYQDYLDCNHNCVLFVFYTCLDLC